MPVAPLIQYLAEIRPAGVTHLKAVQIRRPGRVMLLDEMTRRNLELIEPLRSGEEGGTLLDVLDGSVTPMGGRLLRRWVLEPLVVAEEIWARQEAVAECVDSPELRDALRTSPQARERPGATRRQDWNAQGRPPGPRESSEIA